MNIAVLLIESNPQMRASISKTLSSHGYAVTDLADCDRALPMIELIAFDVVLCCSAPSSMSCEEFAKKAKELQTGLKVIVATPKTEHPNLHKSETVDEVLHKPFFISKLCFLLESLNTTLLSGKIFPRVLPLNQVI